MLRSWSQNEFDRAVQLLSAGWNAPEIAKALGRTETSVRLKLIKGGYSSRVVSAAEVKEPARAPLAESPALPAYEPSSGSQSPRLADDEAFRLLESRELGARNRRERAEAIERAQRERMLEIFKASLAEAHFDFSLPPPKVTKASGSASAAVLLLGDVHVGKVCSQEETEGRAYYNPAFTVARLGHLEKEVIRLIATGPEVDELVILFLGDILDGALDHGAEREETLLISRQFELAVAILSQFVLSLASVVPIRVYGVSGNHGRWPGQRRPPTVGRESNLDGLVYRAIEMVIKASAVPNVRFSLSESPRQTVKVKSTLIALAHGDELRGGEFYTAGIKREVYHSVLRGAREGAIPDLWVTGDKHVPQSLSLGTGQHIINGSFVGEDAYGLRFAPAISCQTMFWVCPMRGKVLQADIRLDEATPADPPPYQLSAPLLELVHTYASRVETYAYEPR